MHTHTHTHLLFTYSHLLFTHSRILINKLNHCMHSGCGLLLLLSLLLLVAQSWNETTRAARRQDKAHRLNRGCAHEHDNTDLQQDLYRRTNQKRRGLAANTAPMAVTAITRQVSRCLHCHDSQYEGFHKSHYKGFFIRQRKIKHWEVCTLTMKVFCGRFRGQCAPCARCGPMILN